MKMSNELPTKLRVLPKSLFKKKIQIVLFNILESEDLYDDFESLVKSNHNCHSCILPFCHSFPFYPISCFPHLFFRVASLFYSGPRRLALLSAAPGNCTWIYKHVYYTHLIKFSSVYFSC